MGKPSIFKYLRRRSFLPAVMLGYVLLFQAILGPAAINAHALAMTQQEILGLAVICSGEGDTGRAEEQTPAGDCINCKIACAAGIAMPALPQPDLVALYIVARAEAVAHALHADTTQARPALFDSDLPARAPPVTI